MAFCSNKDNKAMFKIAFWQIFDNMNVNLRKNEGFLTSIPSIPIPEYGQSNAPSTSFPGSLERGETLVGSDPVLP